MTNCFYNIFNHKVLRNCVCIYMNHNDLVIVLKSWSGVKNHNLENVPNILYNIKIVV